jgi:thiosulfate dehydrogenase
MLAMKRSLLGALALLLPVALLSMVAVPRLLPAAGHDSLWKRGAYLVEGPGHCGSCHSPRGVGFRQKGGVEALSGAVAGGWLAKSLRDDGQGLGDWSEAEIADYLKTGRTVRTAAFGDMSDVIGRHTQHMSDTDLAAVAHYLKSLPGTSAVAYRPDPEQTTVAQLLTGDRSQAGAILYGEFCQDCHRADGNGMARVYPALAGNSAVLTDDPLSLVRIILGGGRMPDTGAGRPALAMPGFSYLSDRDVATLATFVRSSWGNRAPMVSEASVAGIRGMYALGTAPRPGRTPSTFNPPRDIDIPAGPEGDQILLGMRLLRETKRLLPDYVGDQLNCTSCHLGEGKVAFASPFYGVSVKFPEYNPRAGRDVTLIERINGCFLRSMNGKAVPPDSPEMKAMVAYFDWLSAALPPKAPTEGAGIGKINKTLVPDPVHGKVVYANKCALCHGDNGEGRKDGRGEFVFPPLWGDQSFNVGAGMARTYTAAAFAKSAMPLAANLHGMLGQGGALSDQDAVDVGEYFSHQPRPDFPAKVNDWPKGGKPKDARY